jgi:hypothetical protein
MPTVKNLSYGHLSIGREEKESLTLGPRETAEISDEEFESDEIQRHLRDRRIAILPGEATPESQPLPESPEVHEERSRREGRSRTSPATPTPTPTPTE